MSDQLIDDKSCRRCSRCNRQFSSHQGCQDHINMKHGGKGERVPVRKRDDDEPSMAELMIDAQIAMACGEHVDDYLLEMMP